MLSTKEFKARHGLSDSSFSRLRKRLENEYPTLILVSREGSQSWIINHPEIFEEALAKQQKQIEPEVLPTSKITLFDEAQNTTLDTLNQRYSHNPLKQAITLNGEASHALTALEFISNQVEQISSENAEIESQLETRAQTTQTLKVVAKGLGKKLRSEVDKREDLESKAESIEKQENELKKQLQSLLELLQ
jgi:chromosome segregation ATPase